MTNWPIKTLGDLLEFSIGGIWGSEAGEDEVDVFVYRSTELIKDGQLKEELTVRRSITARQLDSRKLEEGDLLLEKSGGGPKTPVGRVGLVKILPGLSVCSNFMQLMRPRKEDILPVYLHYFLNHFHIAGHTEDLQNNSTNIRNLKTTEYMDVEIPVPPLDEQKRIVALLDAATARVTELTACYEQARTHANNLFISALSSALESNPDWPVKTLGDVCDLVGGGTPSKDRPEFYGGGIPWATVRDLNVEVLRTTEHSITAEAVKSSSSNVIPEGSVVIATRVGLGKAVILAQDTAINQDLRGLVVKNPNEVLAVYLFWWYLSTVHLVVAAGTGATVQGVKLPFVSGLAIPVPPLEEQEKIVARLDLMRAKTSEMVAAYDVKVTAAKNLRQSILESAFAGDL